MSKYPKFTRSPEDPVKVLGRYRHLSGQRVVVKTATEGIVWFFWCDDGHADWTTSKRFAEQFTLEFDPSLDPV